MLFLSPAPVCLPPMRRAYLSPAVFHDFGLLQPGPENIMGTTGDDDCCFFSKLRKPTPTIGNDPLAKVLSTSGHDLTRKSQLHLSCVFSPSRVGMATPARLVIANRARDAAGSKSCKTVDHLKKSRSSLGSFRKDYWRGPAILTSTFPNFP